MYAVEIKKAVGTCVENNTWVWYHGGKNETERLAVLLGIAFSDWSLIKKFNTTNLLRCLLKRPSHQNRFACQLYRYQYTKLTGDFFKLHLPLIFDKPKKNSVAAYS
jgi:hypothetical protein